MRAVLSRVPEGVWVMQFRSVRCPERSIFYRQRCSSSNLHTVSLSFHKSTKRLMFLKNNSEAKTWLNWGGKKKSKEASFAHRFLHRHTHSHSYTWKKLLYTRKTEWLQKSFSQKLLRKLLQWQTNTLGAPSYERGFFFPRGAIFYIQNIRICPADNIQKKQRAFGLTSLFKQKDWGVCTPACKNIKSVNVHEIIRHSQQSGVSREPLFLTTSLSVGFCGEPEQGSSPLHFLHLKQSFLF